MPSVRTTCNRDCPDACGILAQVEDGRVVSLKGDPDHPVTKGFLCFRTSRFLDRQYDPQRLTRPLLRRGGRQVEIPLDEALDLAAERLVAIRRESGPAAILHYRSGGSLGMLKVLSDLFFERFGPVSVKSGDVCSGGGDAAQEADFGDEDSNDVFDILNSRHVINWGKNLFVSNVHVIPILKEARARGTKVTLIDPARTKSVSLADRFLQVRPGGDIALALAVARILFEEGRVAPGAAAACDHLEEFRSLCFERPLAELLAGCDLTLEQVRHVADALADGPTAILVGWGLQRRLRGGAQVRMIDALCAISGNLGVRGGGSSFYFKRRGAFDVSFLRGEAPRRICEPLLGERILAAKDPPIRAVWVTCGNPVAMLPDSATVARAFESTEFTVVVDSFLTDTARRATLVLPTTTLLEDDEVLGGYGHHWLGVARPVVPAPEGVLSDLEILQAIAARVGLGDVMAGSARDWKARLLSRVAPKGASLEPLEAGAVRNPEAAAVFLEGGVCKTASKRVNLLTSIPPEPAAEPGFPLWLLSNSTEKAQSSQWAVDPGDRIEAVVHPDSAAGTPDGGAGRIVSAVSSLPVRVRHDAAQRRDVVIVPKGGHYDRGHAANALIRARCTDIGDGAAYLDTRVRVEPDTH